MNRYRFEVCATRPDGTVATFFFRRDYRLTVAGAHKTFWRYALRKFGNRLVSVQTDKVER